MRVVRVVLFCLCCTLLAAHLQALGCKGCAGDSTEYAAILVPFRPGLLDGPESDKWAQVVQEDVRRQIPKAKEGYCAVHLLELVVSNLSYCVPFFEANARIEEVEYGECVIFGNRVDHASEGSRIPTLAAPSRI